MIATWLGKFAAAVARVVIPALAAAIQDYLLKTANRLEEKSAVNAAKAAKTAEEFRDASKKLTDSASRR